MKKYLEQYCVGCGLCEITNKAECYIDSNGFKHPETGDEEWLKSICPAGGRQQKLMDFSNIWGRSKAVYYGWSSDTEVRSIASSGGILTEISSWLLENHKVDGIIHTCANPKEPTKTITCISTTRDELIERCGSRYSISSPLLAVGEIDRSKRYAFVGKPCDINALCNLFFKEPEWKNTIVYTLSFFCAGLPSISGQNKLLDHLGCPDDGLKTLRYRGDGWPGYTTAVDKNGIEYKTDYGTAWGKILGRDIMKMCRFCLDGIGETADVSCGDAWYMTKDRKPDFSEGEGRNVIFARTDAGNEILQSMIAEGNIAVEAAHIEELQYIQPYQWDRRATMVDKMVSSRVLMRPIPHYTWRNVKKYYHGVNLKRHISILKGTALRILKGKV